MVTLTKPSEGDTAWTTSVNQNWTDIQNEMNGARSVTTGGTGTATQLTLGSIVFAGASGVYTQNNSKFFWDNTNNRLGIGTGSPSALLHAAYEASDSARGIRISQHYADAQPASLWMRKSRGTLSSPVKANPGDYIWAIYPEVYDGVGYILSGYIGYVINSGSVGTNYAPSDFIVSTTTTYGAGTEALRVRNDGRVGVNTGSNPLARFDVRESSSPTQLALSRDATTYVLLGCSDSGSDFYIVPYTSGTGQNLLFRTTAFGSSAKGVFVMAEGTAPTSSPGNTGQLWVADRGGTAGKCGFHMRSEDGTSYVFSDLCGIGTVSPTAMLQVLQATVGNEVFRLESVATNNYPNYRVFQGRVATTDATVTTLNTIAISASNTYLIEARVVARRTGGGSGSADDGASYIVRGIYKTVSGTVTLIGSVTVDFSGEDQAAWDATLTISGSNVLVRVTGAASNNVTWHSTVVVQNVGT